MLHVLFKMNEAMPETELPPLLVNVCDYGQFGVIYLVTTRY